MPICTIHLLSLTPNIPLSQFLTTIHTKTSLKPLTIARVIRWIILPTSISISELLAQNIQLLHPAPSDIPPLTGFLTTPLLTPTSQDLTLSGPLRSWITSSSAPTGAVSMLNLLSFLPGKKDQYLKYGAEFAASIGSRRGGTAKIVGSVIGEGELKEWDEIALAHYPSLAHFADMLTGEDYQEVNRKYRVGSLRDTCILCTSELELDAGGGGGGAKL
ncbi:hypothetical protein LHYA1_G007887 [Lachnellula hyalina]|uniref:DUF1330 domain-containing protein n=1 Tax=Lachnellula hyalina TaxID=1316788 RepID=A0A8H8QV85_9HELO|nr:uncharacterized protein LHYA1_G007887 [Lachnellula hyalina]TVY23146.1 hypothetical protein LHYA1_G007887 [Lachnellula hyalina]